MTTEKLENSAVLENHYYLKKGHNINAKTRNICSNADIEILEEIAKILFPGEDFEILVKPSKKGCYQDTLAIIGAMTGLTTVLIAFFSYLSQRKSDKSNIETNKSQQKVNKSQDEVNQLQKQLLQKELERLNIENSDEKAEKIFTSRKIQKSKNDRFTCLRDDPNIEKEEIIAKVNEKVIFKQTINDTDFDDYIDDYSESINLYSEERIHSLVVISDVKNKKYKKWIWKFEDEKTKNRVNFYMKDKYFYDLYLQKNFGLRKIIARVRYFINEYENGEKDITGQEIIFVYKYDNVEISPLPKNETITTPLTVENIEKKNIISKNKVERTSLF